MSLIRCSGHKFNGIRPQNPYGIVNEWKCVECGLKVHTLDAANFLEGKKS